MQKRFFRTIFFLIAVFVLQTVCWGYFSVAMGEELYLDTSALHETIKSETYSEDDLITGYIQEKLYGAKPVQTKSILLAGSYLSGAARALYLQLFDMISQVAAGTVVSTVFTFPVEQIYPQTVFTAQDLGVSAIVSNGAFTPEAAKAISNLLLSIEPRSVFKALLSDCPYALYWYDRTDSGGVDIFYPDSFAFKGGNLTILGSLTVRIAVSSDYSGGEYLVNPSYGQSVTAAVQNAHEIVSRYEGLKDYDRLLAYKNEICALTAYNYTATEENFGNPWQLIWVLDGDPKTNVVCEGYAKAFQYLNDLSDTAVSVISVTGNLCEEKHMWNIVCMEDGKKYLADITNCDKGMAGYPNYLFLAGYADGNIKDGYWFSVAGGRILYQYESDLVFAQTDLEIAAWSYLMGGPPAPMLEVLDNEIYVNEALSLAYTENGYKYDEVIAEITRYPQAVGEEAELSLDTVQIQDSMAFLSVPYWEAGNYSIRFAGERDGEQSAWSDSCAISVAGIDQYRPVYTFSANKGYTGYQLAVQLDSDAMQIQIMETGESIPCEDRIALLPLTEEGNRSFTLAIIWDGQLSQYGDTENINVSTLPESGILNIPPGTRIIEADAFRGIGAAIVRIPSSVEEIGSSAFADSMNILLVEMGDCIMDETAFDHCSNAVFSVSDSNTDFLSGRPFLLKMPQPQNSGMR